jgi:glycosyltransferase involved in cell wall biosynthesis
MTSAHPRASHISAPRLSFVTTCKGRLAHLRESLPRLLAQPETEVIVVDYDCPEDTAGVVARDFPTARLVTVKDAPLFRPSHARNLGAAAAKGSALAFIDADVVIAPDFMARLGPLLDTPRAFFRFVPPEPESMAGLTGSCLLRRSDFLAVGGYDEIMECYGGEDNDLYFRLHLLGLDAVRADFRVIDRVIQHGDDARLQHTRHRSRSRHQRINTAYLTVKCTLLRQQGGVNLPEAVRRQIYALVQDVVIAAEQKPGEPVQFSLDLADDPAFMPLPAWSIARKLVFTLTPKGTVDPA